MTHVQPTLGGPPIGVDADLPVGADRSDRPPDNEAPFEDRPDRAADPAVSSPTDTATQTDGLEEDC
jgi:hypothetical protein